MTYRGTNLEHAAADLGVVFQGMTLLVLLALPFAAFTAPEVAFWGVHPVSFAIPVVYAIGLVANRRVREEPMWEPVETSDTRTDEPSDEDANDRTVSTAQLFLRFFLLMAIMGMAGWVIAKTAAPLTDRFGFAESLVGALGTAVVTSLPELVTTLAAIRRGALALALGGIVGGNTFDVLFLPAADVAYRGGSLYHAVGLDDYFWVAVAMTMTGVLMAGLILRQRHGPARIGTESVTLLLIYAGAIAVQALGGAR